MRKVCQRLVVALMLAYAVAVGTANSSSASDSTSHNSEAASSSKTAANSMPAVSDIVAANLEVDAFGRELTNQINSMAQRAQAAAQHPPDHSQVIWTAIALVVLCIFLWTTLAPRIANIFNNRFNPWTPAVASTHSVPNALSEEQSFSEFVAAFRVGPQEPAPGNVGSTGMNGSRTSGASSIHACEVQQTRTSPKESTANLTQQRTSHPVTEKSASSSEGKCNHPQVEVGSVKPDGFQTFFETAPKALEACQGKLAEITRAPNEPPRQKLICGLREEIRSLKESASSPKLLPFWQMASALEALLQQLIEKPGNVTPSTLRTAQGALDLLGPLSATGVKQDLLSDPPVRLLAVDDDTLTRQVLAFALRKALSQPELAANGEAAMALLEAQSYDAIFLDVQMPGMDGFELCSRIQKTVLNEKTPVVFVTCQSDFETRAKSDSSGAQDLIGKPFLIFEIAVKALTLILRGRLHKSSRGGTKQPSVILGSQVELAKEPALA